MMLAFAVNYRFHIDTGPTNNAKRWMDWLWSSKYVWVNTSASGCKRWLSSYDNGVWEIKIILMQKSQNNRKNHYMRSVEMFNARKCRPRYAPVAYSNQFNKKLQGLVVQCATVEIQHTMPSSYAVIFSGSVYECHICQRWPQGAMRQYSIIPLNLLLYIFRQVDSTEVLQTQIKTRP